MQGSGHLCGASPTNWSRKARDDFQLYFDILFLLDIVVGVVLGGLSGVAYLRLLHGSSHVMASDVVALAGPLWREMILGSVITALVLREPGPASGEGRLVAPFSYGSVARRGCAAAAILLSVGLRTRALDDMARLWVVGWSALFACWLGLSRLAMVRYWQRLAGRGLLRETVAVIGPQDVAARLSERVGGEVEIVAVLDDLDAGCEPVPSGGGIELLLDMARAGTIDTVIVALDRRPADIGAVLLHLKTVPVQIAVWSGRDGLPPATLSLRMLGGMPLAVVADRPLKSRDLFLKGVLDSTGALLMLALASPLMLAACIAVAWESGGPVIFRQVRGGWGGRQFTVYKFRTMRYVPGDWPSHQTERNDPRCTRVGAFLRRASLDELPQLWNVLGGDMSLVGPRPHAEALHEEERAGYAVIAEYAQRQRVKPGLTGWAQIHGLRGAIRSADQLRQRVEYDLYYIDHWSIWLDLRILASTPLAVLRTENAF
jgi:polysaccharide biosynthesis protein PslA